MSTDFKTGAPCWVDLGSPSIEAAAAFYGNVFGWSFLSLGPEAGGYGFFQQNGKTVAALGGLDEGARSAWTVYFRTADADATNKGVEQAGGTVRVAPMDVMDAGRMACFTDPTGAEFAVWQAGATKGLDEVFTPGAFLWAELHTDKQTAALDFYRSLFGWRSKDSELPGIEYTLLSTAEGQQGKDADFGGVAGLMGEEARPGWLVYFCTDDADGVASRAKAAGGTVLMEPSDIPTVGRTTVVADPSGAVFAVLKPEPRQS